MKTEEIDMTWVLVGGGIWLFFIGLVILFLRGCSTLPRHSDDENYD